MSRRSMNYAPRLPRSVVRIGLVAALIGAGLGVEKWVDNNFSISHCLEHPGVSSCLGGFAIHAGLGHDSPGAATAGVDQNSYIQQGPTFNLSCDSTVSVRVNVTGAQHGELGSGDYDKALFGDFEPCGNTGKLLANIKETTDAQTGKVIGVTATLSGLIPQFARINFDDYRNYAPVRAEDSDATANKKIKAWLTAKNEGKYVSRDDGFYTSGAGQVADSATQIIVLGEQAAQDAIALDAQVPEAEVENVLSQMLTQDKDIIEGMPQYKGLPVTVTYAPAETFTQSLQDRLTILAPDFKTLDEQNGTKFSLNKKGQLLFTETAPNCAVATVEFTSSVSNHETPADVANLNAILAEVWNQAVPSNEMGVPTTTTTPGSVFNIAGCS